MQEGFNDFGCRVVTKFLNCEMVKTYYVTSNFDRPKLKMNISMKYEEIPLTNESARAMMFHTNVQNQLSIVKGKT